MGIIASLDLIDVGRLVVDLASDRQASDVLMLDMREVSDFADVFVVMTAESSRQIDDLREEIEKTLEASGEVKHHTEGTSKDGWVLVDFGPVIVHIFRPEERARYRLEDAWPLASELVRIL